MSVLWLSGDVHRDGGPARGRGLKRFLGGKNGRRVRQSPEAVVGLSGGGALPSCGKGLGRLRRAVEGAGPGAAAAGRLEDRRSATDPGDIGCTLLQAGRCVVAAVRRAVAFTWATAVVLRRCPARAAARDGANARELHSCNQQGENRRQFRSGHHRFLYHFPPRV
jgi:hypothetical protein